MDKHNSELLFIKGPPKTGTSTLVGILNCHPEIFILYENYMNNIHLSGYGNRMLAKYPEMRMLFRHWDDFGQPYKKFAAHLEKKEARNYKYFGDKLVGFDVKHMLGNTTYKTIFTIRDLKSWLCKESLIKPYRTDLDIIPVALEFTSYLLGTYRHDNCLRVSLEELVTDNEALLTKLSNFLKLDILNTADRWWEKIGDYSESDPKRLLLWEKGHTSSKVSPEELDTRVEIKEHPFWDQLLPIFNKYYAADSQAGFEHGELEQDIHKLKELYCYSPLPLNDAYSSISTRRLGIKRGLLSRVLRKMLNYLEKK